LIGEPLLAGAVQVTFTPPVIAASVGFAGAEGTDFGVTAGDTPAGETPAEFVAFTENVYAVPYVKPLMTQEFADAPDFGTV
jgi:hypothetical protein